MAGLGSRAPFPASPFLVVMIIFACCTCTFALYVKCARPFPGRGICPAIYTTANRRVVRYTLRVRTIFLLRYVPVKDCLSAQRRGRTPAPNNCHF